MNPTQDDKDQAKPSLAAQAMAADHSDGLRDPQDAAGLPEGDVQPDQEASQEK